jgi:5-formyltetrahydrofolate cyclo-ligase
LILANGIRRVNNTGQALFKLKSISVKKASLRKEFLKGRLALHRGELEERNRLVTEKVMALLKTIPFGVIHVFLPQRNKNEIDTGQIIAKLRALFPDTSVTVPYVIPGTLQMRHFELTDKTELRENKWGIPEPDPFQATLIPPESVDIVLVPLLAFDQQGYRVGYGGGYYDRFLSECREGIIKIGLSFFEPVERVEDLDQYDIPLSYCVTPERIWQW